MNCSRSLKPHRKCGLFFQILQDLSATFSNFLNLLDARAHLLGLGGSFDPCVGNGLEVAPANTDFFFFDSNHASEQRRTLRLEPGPFQHVALLVEDLGAGRQAALVIVPLGMRGGLEQQAFREV